MVEFENDIQECLKVMNQGGIVLYPTDTIWGIGCDATNEAAVAKIYALKQRADEKSMIILMADEKDIENYIDNPNSQVFEFLKTVIKPTTVIYQHAKALAQNLINANGSIAIRIVNDPFCKHLIQEFKKPIVSTSANVSGNASPAFFAEVDDIIKNGVDFIVQHRQNDFTASSPSAIVIWNEDGLLTTIRP